MMGWMPGAVLLRPQKQAFQVHRGITGMCRILVNPPQLMITPEPAFGGFLESLSLPRGLGKAPEGCALTLQPPAVAMRRGQQGEGIEGPGLGD